MADPDYFTVAEFRDLPDMDDDERYTEARILATAASLTSIIEREVGTSFIERSVTETITTCGGDTVTLNAPFARSVTTLTLNGDTVTAGDLLVDRGMLRYRSVGGLFTSGDRGNAVVTYLAGYSDEPPADIKEHLMMATRDRLLATSPSAGINARRTASTNPDGTTVNYVLAGKGHATGYPDLDAAIIGWQDKLSAFGFA